MATGRTERIGEKPEDEPSWMNTVLDSESTQKPADVSGKEIVTLTAAEHKKLLWKVDRSLVPYISL